MTEIVKKDKTILKYPQQDIAACKVATDSLYVVQGGGTNGK